jgi:hypothetical protein
VDEHRRVEQWADAMLERHRTAPPDGPSIEDDLFAEAIERNRRRHAGLAKVDAVVSVIGLVLACVGGFVWLEMF